MTGMSKVLLATHSPSLTTGYGRVARELCAAMAQAGHDVAALGTGYAGEPHPFPYRLLPWGPVPPPPGPQAGAAADPMTLARAIDRERPDVLVTVGDPWMFDGLDLLPQRRGVRWVAYFPVDGTPLPRAWARWIRAVDVPIVFAHFTRDVVRDAAGVDCAVVPHGVDTAVFTPADRAAARARVGVAGAFVVGCVAVNQERKNLPALVRAFARFARDKHDALLYLHTAIDGYWDVEELVLRFGVEPRTRATLNLDPRRGVSDQVLATIYNAFDVFALPTMAEGFGLPILEAQACGVPALVTDYSACPELVPDPFQRLRVRDRLILARNFEQALADEDDLAAKLDALYLDRARLAELGARALAFARGFTWAEMSRRFLAAAGLQAP